MEWIWNFRRVARCVSLRLSIERVTLFAMLDMNVASGLARKPPNPAVEAWVANDGLEDLFFSTVGEVERR